MGCGSSSNTTVEAFRNPEENKSHHKPSKETTRPQSVHSKASSKSRSSSASSKGKVKRNDDTHTEHRSRNSSANTKGTYTIEHNHEHGDTIVENSLEVQTNDVQEETHVFAIDNEIDNDSDGEDANGKHRSDSHEHTQETDNKTNEAGETLEVNNLLDYDEQIILENGLSPLDIPDVDETRQMKTYTVDDLNADRKRLFKYGRKVYCNDIMQPIIKERIQQYAEFRPWYVEDLNNITYPVRVARSSGVTRKELAQLLPVCQVGDFQDLPRDEYLQRMKQGVENILSTDEQGEEDEGNQPESESVADYKQQLMRWLQKYPNVDTENQPTGTTTADPNDAPFPIANEDPSVFQKWIVEWEKFDTEVPEDGAWFSYEFVPIRNPELSQQFHDEFASIVKSHDDETLDAVDMAIDGEAAWNVIELDLVKNGCTTEDQDKIWSLREKRTNLNDPKWMAKRRREIADGFLLRHKNNYNVCDPEIISFHLGFADHLEDEWKRFQTVCDGSFNPPHKYRMLYTPTGGHTDGAVRPSQYEEGGEGDGEHANNDEQSDTDEKVDSDGHAPDTEKENNEDQSLSSEQANNVTETRDSDGEQANNDGQSDTCEEANNDEQSVTSEHANNDEQATGTDQPNNEDQSVSDEQANNEEQPGDSNHNSSGGDAANDNKNTGDSNHENTQNTPGVQNGVQQNGDRPQIETMDSGLELDTSESFYK